MNPIISIKPPIQKEFWPVLGDTFWIGDPKILVMVSVSKGGWFRLTCLNDGNIWDKACSSIEGIAKQLSDDNAIPVTIKIIEA